jgi:hypothetical protein
MKEEKLCLEKNPGQTISESICKHIDFLKAEIEFVEENISEVITAIASKEAEVLMVEVEHVKRFS